MSDVWPTSLAELAAVVARVGPFAVATSWVGLGALPRSARAALAAVLALAIAPAASDLRGGVGLALAQGVAVALGALAPLVASTSALEATARLAALPRGWDALFSTLVALSYLLLGGLADVARALSVAAPLPTPTSLALALGGGVMSGLALAGPMLVGRVGVEALMVATARAELGRTWIVARNLALWGLAALLARRLVFRAL